MFTYRTFPIIFRQVVVVSAIVEINRGSILGSIHRVLKHDCGSMLIHERGGILERGKCNEAEASRRIWIHVSEEQQSRSKISMAI